MSTAFSPLPSSLRIGVLRGGPSPEYEVSLKSGAHVLKHLSETYRPLDIFISRDGIWHMHGVERSPERILKHVDVVFNALHGSYGEDGGVVQEVLHHHGVPYTGSDKYSSALAMNKFLTKQHALELGIKTPLFFIVRESDPLHEKAKEIFNSVPHPLVVKPATGGSSQGLFVVESFSELLAALEHILSQYPSALVEEHISGKPVSCFVLHDFRGQDMYVFPPSEKVSREETGILENNSHMIHNALKLSHFSQSDFIVSPRRGIYFLEVNTTPKFEEKSLFHRALETVGVDTMHFINHMLSLAVNRK